MFGFHARLHTGTHVARLIGRGALFLTALVAIALAASIARPRSTPGPPLRDFESYYAAGATWRYEGDPYSREIWRTERAIPQVDAARDELLPFVGPPLGLPFWSALSRLSWPRAVQVWYVYLVLAVATLGLGSLRLAGRDAGIPEALAVFIVAAGFGPLTSGVALGQAAIVSCAAVVCVPLVLRPRLLGAAFAAAFVAALQPNLALVLAARLSEGRSWLALGCAAIVAAGTSALALGGPAGFAHYLDVLRAHAAAERFIAIQTAPAAVLRALGASAETSVAAATVLAALVIATVAAQCVGRRYVPSARLALGCAALPLALPFSHEHDLTIAFLPAILTIRAASGATWVAGACATLLVATDWLGFAQRPQGALETELLTLAAALGCALLARGPLRPHLFIPLLVIPASAAVAGLAAVHPLPTWPDALGPHFSAAFRLPAATVWYLEQQRSGITQLVPAWGWLRALSLAGCALLWLAASLALRTAPAPVPRA